VLKVLGLSWALLAPSLWACAAEAGGPDEVARVLVLEPGPDNPRNSEGDFIALEDGRLMFVYTHFTGGAADHAPAHLAARYSTDGGRTWTGEDVVIVPNEGGRNVMSVSLLRLQSGEVALFYLRKNSDEDCIPYLRRSADEGATWSGPTRCIPLDGYYVVNNDRVVQLETGRLVIPAALHGLPGKGFFGRGVAMCFLSDDNGATWRRSKTTLEGPQGSKTGLQEPGVIALNDGRLMMLCRTDQGCQMRSFSSDGGDTWSPPEKTGILSPVSPASFERIPATGDLLLVWNDHSAIDPALRDKRTPFTVAVSKDEGRTWENTKTLEDDPDGWYCYTAVEFVDDHVLLGHCGGDRRTGGLNRLQVLRLPVAWLYR